MNPRKPRYRGGPRVLAAARRPGGSADRWKAAGRWRRAGANCTAGGSTRDWGSAGRGGRRGGARAAFEQALRFYKDPADGVRVILDEAQVLADTGQRQQAIDLLRRHKEDYAGQTVGVRWIRWWPRLGRNREVAAFYRRCQHLSR